jgi:uncharacterized protein (DUF433 family)
MEELTGLNSVNNILEMNNGRERYVGTRIDLGIVVMEYNQGMTAEQIVDGYPSLSLAQVHYGIAYYLANKTKIDADVKEAVEDHDRRRAASIYEINQNF